MERRVFSHSSPLGQRRCRGGPGVNVLSTPTAAQRIRKKTSDEEPPAFPTAIPNSIQLPQSSQSILKPIPADSISSPSASFPKPL